jgi:uncharacterized protein
MELEDDNVTVVVTRVPGRERDYEEAWFTVAGERAIVPPPRWKQLLATLVGAYPLVILLFAFVLPRLAGWPLLVRSAMLPVVLLTLMTYVVMPQVTKLLRGWLYSRQTMRNES